MRPRVRCRTPHRGYPDAHSIELTAAQLLDECDQLFEQRGRTGSLVGATTDALSSRPCSEPAATLVPPRSTPMTITAAGWQPRRVTPSSDSPQASWAKP